MAIEVKSENAGLKLDCHIPPRMLIADVGIETLAKELHPINASEPMCLTELGISTLLKEVHAAKALEPMMVIDVGKSTLAKELQ